MGLFNWLFGKKSPHGGDSDSATLRLLKQNMRLVQEVVRLVQKDERDDVTAGGFGSKVRIRQIGEELNRMGVSS